MAEYNFWDDRTTEDNDEHFCPIIDGVCYHNSDEDCEDCPFCLEFEFYLRQQGGDNADG